MQYPCQLSVVSLLKLQWRIELTLKITKMHLFLIFAANNSKITNLNSLFYLKTQLINNQFIMIKSFSKQLGAALEEKRRYAEGRAKGERRISVTLLNIKHFKSISSLYIIRNKNPKTPHFPHFLIC